MSRDTIVNRLNSVVRSDRLELMRANADKQHTYCFYASLYEVASFVHKGKLPLRYQQAEDEWLSFGVQDSEIKGGVPPKEFFTLIMKMADYLEIKIERIYADPSILAHFLKDKAADAKEALVTSEMKVKEENEAEYAAHAESQTTSRSVVRVQSATDHGWETAFVIAFSQDPYHDPRNNIDSIPVEDSAGKTIEVPIPFLHVMLKEKPVDNNKRT